jgi:hypothetical protein
MCSRQLSFYKAGGLPVELESGKMINLEMYIQEGELSSLTPSLTEVFFARSPLFI